MRLPDAALFAFTLDPLEDIDASLHEGDRSQLKSPWLALTRGRYWMNVGEQRLFTLSQAAERHPPFDYHVARLWGDTLNALPATLETVPIDLATRLSAASDWLGWNERVKAWTRDVRPPSTIADIDALALALSWADERRLNTGYWVGGPNIWVVRTENVIRISWDNRALVWDGVPSWTASVGEYELTVQCFLDELAGFNQRLLETMAARIAHVRSGAAPSSAHVDVLGLDSEQADRALALGRARARAMAISRTDWRAVTAALSVLEHEVP